MHAVEIRRRRKYHCAVPGQRRHVLVTWARNNSRNVEPSIMCVCVCVCWFASHDDAATFASSEAVQQQQPRRRRRQHRAIIYTELLSCHFSLHDSRHLRRITTFYVRKRPVYTPCLCSSVALTTIDFFLMYAITQPHHHHIVIFIVVIFLATKAGNKTVTCK